MKTTPLLLVLAACAPVRFVAQEIHLRHHPTADALEVVLLYEGLHARPPAMLLTGAGGRTRPLSSDAPLQESERWVARMADGERVFVLLDWPFVFDFEEGRPESEDPPWGADLGRRLQALADSIELVEAQLFVDGDGRLGALQRLRWKDLEAGLATVNELLNLWARHATPPPEEFEGHPRTRELLLEHALERRPWLALVDGALEVRVPLAPEDFAATLRDLLEPGADADARAVAHGLLGARAVSLDGRGLALRYAPEADGRVRLRFRRPNHAYDDGLREVLASGGMGLPVRTWAQVRERAAGD